MQFLKLILGVFVLVQAVYSDVPRHWLNTCNRLNCQNALDQCKLCNGRTQCKLCLSHYNPECEICANDIFNTDDHVQIDGEYYLLCDASDSFQQKICRIFCRGEYFTESNCKRLNSIPICFCF